MPVMDGRQLVESGETAATAEKIFWRPPFLQCQVCLKIFFPWIVKNLFRKCEYCPKDIGEFFEVKLESLGEGHEDLLSTMF